MERGTSIRENGTPTSVQCPIEPLASLLSLMVSSNNRAPVKITLTDGKVSEKGSGFPCVPEVRVEH